MKKPLSNFPTTSLETKNQAFRCSVVHLLDQEKKQKKTKQLGLALQIHVDGFLFYFMGQAR
jgi:hypothetical protein